MLPYHPELRNKESDDNYRSKEKILLSMPENELSQIVVRVIAALVIENKLILKSKSKTTTDLLKLSDIKQGRLINFNVPLIKDGIQRIVYRL